MDRPSDDCSLGKRYDHSRLRSDAVILPRKNIDTATEHSLLVAS
jgi:hypothetical protein